MYRLLIFTLSAASTLSESAFGIEYIPLNTKKQHVEFNLGKGTPILKFFTKRDLKGSPAVELSNSGLSVSGKAICFWPKGQFDISQAFNMVLAQVPSGPCRAVNFLRSTWGDGGTGTAVLTIEIVKLENDLITVSNNNSFLFTDLKNIKDQYRLRAPGELSNSVGD